VKALFVSTNQHKSLNMNEKEQVLDALKKADNPLKSGEIAELTGLEKKIVDKQIKTLKAEAAIESPKRCYYSAK
jgi:biotin operon repressor